MNEPRPVFMMVGMALGALALLLLWVYGWGEAVRTQHFWAIARHERTATGPPSSFLPQVAWLARHRAQALQGMVGLGVVALVVGVSEGIALRQRAVYGGFLHRAWTIGVLLAPLFLVGCAFYVVAPWPLGGMVPLVIGVILVGLAGFTLAAGLPFIS